MTEAEVSTSLEGIEKAISILKDARHWTAMDVEVEAGRAREALEATQQDLENWLERKTQPPQELVELREAIDKATDEIAGMFSPYGGTHWDTKQKIRAIVERAALTRGEVGK